jgi:glycosyltransferase involved in cell wall biosynthesis
MAVPRVSAIIIFRNEERFIRAAVASVLDQSYTDWELLLVDDGSLDSSPRIAAELANGNPNRIFCFSHPANENRGMSASRNLGLLHARGEFVGFLDADDLWLQDKLMEQVAILERERKAALVYGRTLIWANGTAEADMRNYYYDLGLEPELLQEPPKALLVMVANKCQTPTTCNALIRLRVAQAVGGFEESFRGLFEDQVFFAKILLQHAAFVSGRTWAKYRQHPNSTSAKASALQTEEARLRFLTWLKGHMKSSAVTDYKLQALVAYEKWRSIAKITKSRIRSERGV